MANATSELVDLLLKRAIAETLVSLDGFQSIDQAALFHLCRLTEQTLDILAQRILACTRVKGRTRVSSEDVELALLRERISTGALEDELNRTVRHYADHERPALPALEVCADKVPKRFENVLDRRAQAQLLGPDLNGRRRPIPEYMQKEIKLPALPPLYTHQHTPVYTQRIESELEMRERVLQETQLVEASLWRLVQLDEEASQAEEVQAETSIDTFMEDADKSGESSHAEEAEQATSVMSRSALRQMAKRRRLGVFAQVWKNMSYGDLVRQRPTNVEQVKQAGKVR